MRDGRLRAGWSRPWGRGAPSAASATGLLLPFLLALGLLGLGAVAAQAGGEAQGTVTVHATPQGPATERLEGCEFFVRGHGVAGPAGAVVFLYAPGPDAPDGAYQPTQAPFNFTGTANATGGYDFVVGPLQVPADDGADDADLVFVNVTTADGFQELSLEPDLACARPPPATDVPFFPSPAGIGLAALGVVAAGSVVLWRRR